MNGIKVILEAVYKKCPNNSTINHDGPVIIFEGLESKDENGNIIIKNIYICVNPYKINPRIT